MADAYEDSTVEELRDELRARDLPVSGHKDELITRLEEDDAAKQDPGGGQGPGGGGPPGQGGGSPPASDNTLPGDLPSDVQDPYVRVYSPYELPANTAAAQAFTDTHPESVDPSLELPPEQVASAQAAIQDHVDQQAAMGITVDDPRLEGYTPPPPPEEPASVEANA